jgi:surface polysaccharide O-acyltransferase-like enzyme
MSTTRLPGLDALKGVAIVAVVAIHVLAVLYRPSIVTAALATSSAVSFAVPVFVAISVFFAAQEWLRTHSWSVVSRRAIRLVPLYLLWTGIYLLFRWSLGDPVGTDLRRHNGLDVLFRGAAAPHLYYVPILIEVLVFVPLLATVIRSTATAWLVIGAGVVALAVGVALRDNQVASALIERDWFPVWLPVASVGVAAAAVRLRAPVALLWTAAAGAALIFYALALRHPPLTAHQLYAAAPLPLVVVGLLTLGAGLRSSPRWLAALGRNSLGVYLVHVIVLRLLLRAVHFSAQGLLGVAAVTALVTVVSVVVVEGVDRTPGRVIFEGWSRPAIRSGSGGGPAVS